MATVEDIHFEPQGVCLARPELLVRSDADLLVEQYDAQRGNPPSAISRDGMSIWVSEAAAVLHAFAALSARLDLRIDTEAVVQLADSFPALNALSEHSEWTRTARDMLVRCAVAVSHGTQEICGTSAAPEGRNRSSRRPAAFASPGYRPKG